MNSLIEQLDLYFGKKAPQLPVAFKEGIVKYAYILTIIGLIFTAIGLVTLFPLLIGLSAVGAVLGNGGGFLTTIISLVVAVITAILYFMALPGLKNRTINAWDYLFYALLIRLLADIISFNIVGFIISALIGFYFLFQIRAYYTGAATVSAGNVPPVPPTTSVPPAPTV